MKINSPTRFLVKPTQTSIKNENLIKKRTIKQRTVNEKFTTNVFQHIQTRISPLENYRLQLKFQGQNKQVLLDYFSGFG
jgi:hypothetical protein